jgi:hypothetical protein
MVQAEIKSRAPAQRLPQDLSQIGAEPSSAKDMGVPGEGE